MTEAIGRTSSGGVPGFTQLEASIGSASGICPLNASAQVSTNYLPQATTTTPGTVIGTTSGPSIWNTFLGDSTGIAITTGIENTLIGQGSGSYITTGFGNVFVGMDAGTGLSYYNGATDITTGGYNVFIGREASGNSASVTNAISLGSGAVSATNQFSIDPHVTTVTFPGLGHSTNDDGSNNIVAVDSSGNLWKTGGTHNTVSAIDSAITTLQSLIPTTWTPTYESYTNLDAPVTTLAIYKSYVISSTTYYEVELSATATISISDPSYTIIISGLPGSPSTTNAIVTASFNNKIVASNGYQLIFPSLASGGSLEIGIYYSEIPAGTIAFSARCIYSV